MLSKPDFNANDNDLGRRLVRGGQTAASLGGKETAGGYMVVSGLMYILFGFGALAVRLLLRRNMGERTFGVLSILLSYFWLKYAYIGTFVYSLPCDTFGNFDCENVWIRWLLVFIAPLFEMTTWLFKIESSSFGNTDIGRHLSIFAFPRAGEESLLPYFALIVLALGIFSYIEMFTRKTHTYTYYRGQSVFFNWLQGKKIGNLYLNETMIWLIVEPLAVLIFGILVFKMFEIGRAHV